VIDDTTVSEPGRVCPARYRYAPSAIAKAPERPAETLYVTGGGHDPAMVRSALTASLSESLDAGGGRVAELVLANTGAAHFLPTGTPDRHLTVRFRVLDAGGLVIREKTHTLERTVMWRPFIVDLWDTRLPRGAPRHYRLALPSNARTVEAQVRYYLLAESRRKRIGYAPDEPIFFVVFDKRLDIRSPAEGSIERGTH